MGTSHSHTAHLKFISNKQEVKVTDFTLCVGNQLLRYKMAKIVLFIALLLMSVHVSEAKAGWRFGRFIKKVGGAALKAGIGAALGGLGKDAAQNGVPLPSDDDLDEAYNANMEAELRELIKELQD